MKWSRTDLDFAFIREFAVGGERVTRTNHDSEERLLIQILESRRQHTPFFNSGMTYAQAFTAWCGRPAALRTTN